MYKIENKNIYLNRGDQIIIKLNNVESNFNIGDTLKFSITKKGNCSAVVFQKTFLVEEAGPSFEMVLTSEETRLGDVIKSGSVVYWYEIEYNGNNTLIGYDENGPKEFVLYPEVITEAGV